VRVPADVKRIVSLAPNLTEIVFALNLGDRLAGDTDYCDYPAAATQKPHVGGPVNPNLEEIAKLAPDLILATSINRRETVDSLDRLGMSVYYIDPQSVDAMIASTERLGSVLGAAKSGVALAETLRARLADLDRRLTGATPRGALFVVQTDPLISVGRSTFIADAIRLAGGRSVVEMASPWPHMSLEEIVRLQPEFLVFAEAHGRDMKVDVDSLRSRPGWRDLEAIRLGHIVIVSDAINRPAPRMLDAVEQLAHAFHSELFAANNAAQSMSPAHSGSDLNDEVCACAR
jgi:iron complex transport system substrate-binding protein